MRQPGTSLLPTNLKFRLSCVVVVLVLAATLLVSLSSMLMAEQDMKTVIGDQQLAVLSSAAAFIDDRLDAKKQLLRALADDLPAADRRDPAKVRAYLAGHTGLRSEFYNLAAFSPDGVLLASMAPVAPHFNATGHQFFDATIAAKRGIVSSPFQSPLTGLPVVQVTAPLLDAAGKVELVLTGGVALHDSAFLRQIDQLKPGATGFLFIMTADGVLIDHPDKRRELHHINERGGRNKATERALAGFEGTMEADNKDGQSCIYTYKRLKAADWILGARFPVAEAFAPMIAMRDHSLAATVLVALVAGLLAWLLMHRMLAPLETLRRNVSAIRRQGAPIAVLQSGRSDEIGELGEAFHELMAAREADRARLRESEKRAYVIADNMPALIGYINAEQRYEFANAQYQKLVGFNAAGMLGRTVRDVLGEENYARVAARLQAALSGELQHFDQQFAGVNRHFMIDYIPATDADGRTKGVYVLARDISERRAAALEKEVSERRLKLITDHLPVLISYIDRAHHFRFGNATFQRWLGIDPATLAGRPVVEVLGDDAYTTAREHLENAFGGWTVTYESRMTVGGKQRILETTYVPDVQADGSVAGVYGLSHDLTRLKETEEKLTRLARVDSLTGIANRRMFAESLQHAIERSRRYGAGLALAYLDIDLFKKINDTHGHAVGDEVLKEFARRLQASVRGTDMVARLSGDEFVIIIDELNQVADCRLLAEKIAAAIRIPFHVAGLQLHVTTSVGVSRFGGGQETDEQLLANADSALYAAKRNGRDGVAVFGDVQSAAPDAPRAAA
jgi:diguanylate cyclase (GGDEF)-like protein/PAS domain S-box-containing protein